jgi:type I restriction-modification system DNA methylase subunit
MLDTQTKKRIDDCRSILVGKLPDPKAQIEQITIGLIYKFMDDMDKEAVELGGTSKFFTGDYAKYAWDKLFDTKVTANEMLSLYSQSIVSMEKNPNIPQLFRNIFKNAYLPYKDPETLKLFLKTISYFEYTHSEKLGDAFEYLLSIMGSQGDAGQFRTPRHIIEFLVEVVEPTKQDLILDPSCGTAGFLISAYNFIIKNSKGGLNPDDQKKLLSNFVGYDISPDMVRLSLVNLYLHGFVDPKVYEYDTLSDDARWNETFDVILANPPFMTPKGGIRPHKKFTIQSSRSEALFVDYIIEHVNSKGKGGIIIPDGIVNNSTYVKLREMLLNNGLYSVVSLHQDVFRPYAGAKTSILFFDKSLEGQNGNILFLDIENDGYQRGSLRYQIDANDLTFALSLIKKYKSEGKSLGINSYIKGINGKAVNLFELDEKIFPHYKENLTLYANTYIYDNSATKSINRKRIKDLFKIQKGELQSTKAEPGQYRFITASDELLNHETFTHDCEAIIIAVAAGGSLGKVHYANEKFIASDLCFILTPKKKSTNVLFYSYYFKNIRQVLVKSLAKGVGKQSINKTDFENFFIDDFSPDIQSFMGNKILSSKTAILDYYKKISELENSLIDEIDKIKISN